MIGDSGIYGAQQPGPMVPGPQPVEPKKSSGLLKGCLIAGGIMAVAAVLVLGAGGWLAWNNSGKWMAAILEKGKPEFIGYLSEDHTPEQRAEAEQVYDAMTQGIRESGLIATMSKHEKSWRIMQAIAVDQKITPDETRLWINEWYNEIGQPVPETPGLETPSSETAAPETTAPETTAPETTEPGAMEDETAKPETAEPETPEPETPEPEIPPSE